MGEILVLLGEIIGYILDAVGLLSTLQGILGNPAQQSNLLTTETLAGEGTTAVTDPISGTHAIWSRLGSVQTGTAPSLQTITNLLDGLSPSPLPPAPPVDWGAVMGPGVMSTEQEAPTWGEEWPYSQPYNRAFTQFEQMQFGEIGATGWANRENPDFALVFYRTDVGWSLVGPESGGSHKSPPVELDWSEWNGQERLLTFLQRVAPDYLWDNLGPGGYQTPGICWAPAETPPYRGTLWRCLVEEWMLPFKSGRLAASLQHRLAPLWPGLDGVTLGDPVALTGSSIITGPMDGVLLDITANKPGAGHFGTDGTQYTYRGGWLTFLDATGRAEEYQYLGWNSAFLLTKQMPRAGGVCVVLRDIAACTVTPFTLL